MTMHLLTASILLLGSALTDMQAPRIQARDTQTSDTQTSDTQAFGHPDSPAHETAFTFVAANGDSVEAYRGQFQVPENRGNDRSRLLNLQYVRFPAIGDKTGVPIVYLAGGPGGSGCDSGSGGGRQRSARENGRRPALLRPPQSARV